MTYKKCKCIRTMRSPNRMPDQEYYQEGRTYEFHYTENARPNVRYSVVYYSDDFVSGEEFDRCCLSGTRVTTYLSKEEFDKYFEDLSGWAIMNGKD